MTHPTTPAATTSDPVGYLTRLFTLQDHTAIVTGGTGGLGSAMTIALAKAGANIISIELANDPLSDTLATSTAEVGVQYRKFECDVRDAKSLRACYARIWAAVDEDGGLGQPDILLNCAGVMRRNKCEDATDEEMDLIFDINVKAVYVLTQEFGRRLLTQGRSGKVINIASVTSFQANVNTSVYATSKGGVLQMTKAFSNEWASRGVCVNSIAPGFMLTAMTEPYTKDPKINGYLMGRVPAARWGLPQDLEGAVVFLASAASNFVTGTHLAVDGGFLAK